MITRRLHRSPSQGAARRGILPLALALAIALIASGASADDPAPLKTETGRFAKLVKRLASREYVIGSPRHDDRPYADPAAALHAFRHLASAMAWGDVAAAARQAEALDYELVAFTDADTGHEYYVLRENLAAASQLRGWGSYIVNPHSRVDAVIEVPHPLADLHTPEVGGSIFAACGARGLLIAGTHREKADVPDLVDSIFHQVHMAWIGPNAQVAAYQIHGFDSAKHPFPKATRVVVSTGDGAVPPAIADLDATLEERGLASYVFNQLAPETQENRQLNDGVPGVTFKSLAAAKNEQGRLSRSLGGAFVHVELEGDVRSNAQTRTLAGEAIATVIAGAAHQRAAARTPVSITKVEAEDDAQPKAAEQTAADETSEHLATASATRPEKASVAR
jgi:hypothetical protein